MKQKILLFNAEDQKDLAVEKELLKNHPDFDIILMNDQDDSKLAEIAEDVDGLITIYSKVSADVISRLKNCKVIAVQAIGYDNIDLAAATDAGICIANVPDFCITEVATHTVALALACVRKLIPLNNTVKNGAWEYRNHKINRMEGKTYGLISFGNIPKAMVPMIKGFGMNIITFDPYVSDETCQQYGVRKADTLDELLSESDIISVHTPLMSSTIDLIGENELKKMKNSAYLVNTARGRIVNEPALLNALQNGWIAGAALDVIADEKHHDTPLLKLDNLIITPHISFYSEEAITDMRVGALNGVLSVLGEKKYPKNLVNKDVKGKARFEKI